MCLIPNATTAGVDSLIYTTCSHSPWLLDYRAVPLTWVEKVDEKSRLADMSGRLARPTISLLLRHHLRTA
jgi:hypothetical protein